MPPVTSENGLYEVSHSDAEITYNTDVKAINNLKQTDYRFAGENPANNLILYLLYLLFLPSNKYLSGNCFPVGVNVSKLI